MRLRRDGQAWVYDYVLQQTGRAIQFQGDLHGWLPKTVRQHDMISKHIGLAGMRLEALAREELEQGHGETAMELFYEAAGTFANAQHTILETNEEKRLLHGSSVRCFDELAKLAPYPVERVEIPFEGAAVHANLHLLPDRRKAPCVVFLPGCDMTKEMFPYPGANQAHRRGMHIVSMDGPGQGQCNIDGTLLTSDNYARGVSAVIDHLLERDEVDADRIAVWGLSFASLWGMQAVARDHRPAAVALPWATLADLYYLTTHDSPRYKRLFAYVTGAAGEDELDEILAGMSVVDDAPKVECPALVTAGEYDPRSPLDDILAVYDSMACEREMWIFADQHHGTTMSGRVNISERSIWDFDTVSWTLDWIRDRLDGKPIEGSGEVTYLTRDTLTPHGPSARKGRNWIEAMGLEERLRGG
jgi:cephalosporin-C deacetylase-like acetyl esterase